MIRCHHMLWNLLLICFLLLSGCSLNPQADQAGKAKKIVPPVSPQKLSLDEVLDRLEETMETSGWRNQVQGNELLTLETQGETHRSGADYEANVWITAPPRSLHSIGVITSKGKEKPEEMYLVDDTVYLQVGTDPWKKGPLSDPDMATKVEDVTKTVADLKIMLQEDDNQIEMSSDEGPYILEVKLTSQPYADVRHLSLISDARQEMDSAIEQLTDLGFQLDLDNIRLESYEDRTTIDHKTFQLQNRNIRFQFTIPAGSDTITYEQRLDFEMEGTFDETVNLPDEVKEHAVGK